MKSGPKPLKQALNPAFLKQKPERTEIELFKNELNSLLRSINEDESEEHNKNLLMNFLNNVYYRNNHYINTKDRTDLVIHNGKDAKTPVGVLIEVKRPSNKTEMVSRENLNAKSFQELVLYYLRERKTGKNFELRYLVITNVFEWFVFDAQDFEKLFYKNKTLLKHFEQFQDGKLSGTSTDFFYKEIASPEIQKLQAEIPYTHFDIRNYEKILRKTDKQDDRKLIALYKFLSPVHLLKQSFANDNNQLNKEFYAELLHIIGLEEIKVGGQKLIVRKKANERDFGSIIENAIDRISITDKLDNLPNVEQFGKTKEERLFGVALDLSITWINRILFLKLLESQILKYHNGNKDYAFLLPEKLNSYTDLVTLFFSILACKEENRPENTKSKFAHVPYLNSSLFEKTDVEDKTIFIGSLQDNIKIPLYPKSVLFGKGKSRDIKEMSPLEYLLRFLDAYDFSSEGSEDIQEENKPLISASVLGLIFEKINGYKDGSFFTPSFITMYMCRETIEKAVIQKFNEIKDWNCETIKELHNNIESKDTAEANTIFNSIRICDPSVGSGHFLVSALNEMIALKAELGILVDKDGKKLKDYNVVVANDELIITDSEGEHFAYNPKNAESQRVQETFFREKQIIIENCLFGVDINPNSVKICQLRLWIELLKHAYYRTETKELETLPNIDINIKCGNSLISRFSMDDKYIGNPALQQKIKNATTRYKECVYFYKRCDEKEMKQQFTKKIEEGKGFFYQLNNANDIDYQNLQKAEAELMLRTQSFNFHETESEEWNKKTIELTEKVRKLETKYNDKKRSSFEWRFEFPEVLDEDGNFVGFDVVIGNPPYIQLQSMGSITDVYKQMDYQTFERTGDIYCLFYELGEYLLKPQGRLCFITSNKWMRAGYGESMRKFLIGNTNPELLIDFAGIKVFDEATVDVNILMYQKDKNRQQTQACIIKKEGIKDLRVFVNQNATTCNFGTDSWVILSPIEQRIKAKIEAVGTPLRDWDINIYRGILTGYNEAFIIDGKKKDELVAEDPKSAEIIRPILRGRDIKRYGYDFADLWLINTHNGVKEKGIKPINIDDFPAIKNHLDKYYSELEKRQDKGDTPYNLRNCVYMEDFSKQKIVYPETTQGAYFAFDEGEMFIDKTCFMLISKDAKYIQATLSSKLFEFAYKTIFSSIELGASGYQYNKHALIRLPVLLPILETKEQIETLLKYQKHNEIDKIIYKLYDLNDEEIEFIISL